jgi:SAM-dependent methyltransferase
MFSHLNPKELNKIETSTLGHYNANAASFWEGTKDHDVSQNRAAFLGACVQKKPLDILDFGCGPGRDLKYFKDLGHQAIGLDGCQEFARLAHQYTGCQILQQTFLDLKLPEASFDGVFANASLFHVPSQELPRVLQQLHKTLRTGGILFTSNPRGNGEGWKGQRYGNYMELETSKSFLETAGFKILDHYYRPSNKPPAEQLWLAIVSQKV